MVVLESAASNIISLHRYYLKTFVRPELMCFAHFVRIAAGKKLCLTPLISVFPGYLCSYLIIAVDFIMKSRYIEVTIADKLSKILDM